MSSFTHPIIVPSDFDVEDAFSYTHSPDYTPASSDYFPASPGNTSSLSENVPIAPPTTLPPSPVLSPMFDFFIPEEILPPHKRSHFRSTSSTNPPAQPQAIEWA
ncbi:hypothetical protein Tco_0239407 [Tanacetum coccineum]